MKANRCYEELVAALVFVFGLLPAGIGATPGPVWSYSLLEGSHLVDDCPPCGRPTIAQPMRGTFELRLVEENPISTRYEVERVAFTAGAIAGSRGGGGGRAVGLGADRGFGGYWRSGAEFGSASRTDGFA